MSKKIKKRLFLGGSAFTAALSLAALAGSPAFASQSGESDTWSIEAVVGTQIHSDYGMDQTRDSSGNLVDVWVDDNHHVVVSYNNGPAYTWTNSATGVAPAVISTPWGFRVFHTGVDANVYYAGFEVNSNGSLTLGSWQRIPNNVRTTFAPSVTALPGANQEQWMLAYTGLDGNVYTQYHQRLPSMAAPGHFDDAAHIPGATSHVAPHITITHVTVNGAYIHDSLFVDYADTNGRPQIEEQPYGNPNWNRIASGPAASNPGATPSIEFAGDSEHGIITQTPIDVRSPTVSTATFSYTGGTSSSTRVGSWQAESTNRQTYENPVLSPWANGIYILEPNTNSQWSWKQLYRR
ncbi:hypothetical protein [Streptomyces sp. NPDC048663]|uniref:hypothetical protein n=1 Tax=Streptomyces sp. NPDC048663 TaxID=3155638 RepID=UPI00343911E1